MSWWSFWWAWAVIAAALGVLEILLPTQIILGFAIGAALTSLSLLAGILGLAGSLPLTLLAFAVYSLIAWLVVRRLVGVRPGQVKHWDRDINDD